MSNVHDVLPAAKTILSVDSGKFKSVACVLDVAGGSHRFETIPINPAAVHDLLAAVAPGRLVIEACPVAGWMHDLAVALSIPVQVANTNGEVWHNKRVKGKTDRDDALKLTKLSLLHMPPPAVRQWKIVIKYRHALVDRRTGSRTRSAVCWTRRGCRCREAKGDAGGPTGRSRNSRRCSRSWPTVGRWSF